MVKRFAVYLIETGTPARSHVKPAVVVSPDELNATLPYVTVAPITSKIRYYPFRVNLNLKEKEGQIALDQLQTVPKEKLAKKIGSLPEQSHTQIADILKEMFELG